MKVADIIKKALGTRVKPHPTLTVGRVKNAVKPKKISSQVKQELTNEAIGRFKVDIGIWREALAVAETTDGWDRQTLYAIYKEIADDSQVTANRNTRTFAVTLSDYSVLQNGELNAEVTELFNSYWFFQFMEFIMDSVFYGYSLTELQVGETVEGILQIQPQNTAPEYGAIKKDSDAGVEASNLVKLEGSTYEPYTVEVFKNRYDLGLLNKVAPYYIWKNVFGSWSEHADRFGMPFRFVKTDLTDIDRVKNAKSMLENMVRSSYGIFSEEDVFELDHPIRDGFNIYEKLIDKCDQAISKIILGQTGTTDEKAYAGSADVHKGILDNYTRADKKFVGHIVNSILMPKLVALGLVPEGVTFVWHSIDSLSLDQKVDAIVKLSDIYQISTEFVAKWTNIPVEEKENEVEETASNYLKTPTFALKVESIDKFKAGAFKRRKVADGVTVLYGESLETKLPQPQSYYFDFAKFDAEKAKEWLLKNKAKNG